MAIRNDPALGKASSAEGPIPESNGGLVNSSALFSQHVKFILGFAADILTQDKYGTTLGTASLLGSLAAVVLFWFVKIRRVKLD